MAETTADVLRTAAGPDLFRLNAFRATGLPTTADHRAIRQRRQQVVAAMSMGADVDRIPSDVDADEVRAAFDRLLEEPRYRLIDEFFWLWDVPGADCACPSSLHIEHDKATIAHGMALDQEFSKLDPPGADRSDLDRLWSEAARLWDGVLRRNATWDHMRHRAGRLGDRRLDDTVVDELRAGLPAALLRPLVALAVASDNPEPLARCVRGWTGQGELAGDMLVEAAGPLYEKIDDGVRKTRELLEEGELTEAIDNTRSLPVTLLRLRAMLPPDEFRRTANACELVAIAYNNCANRIFEQCGPLDDRYDDLLNDAEALAINPQTRATIRENREAFRENAQGLSDLLDQITYLARSGQHAAAGNLAAHMRVRLADLPGAVAEIDRVTAQLRSSGVRVSAGADSGGSDVPWGGIITIGALLLGVCFGLADCDGDNRSAPPPAVSVTTSVDDPARAETAVRVVWPAR
ncbi:hypothetical protein [Actinoplanes sp. CA-252034]|uniref:hypothetical protein n=1 Tax=Actinoplanes sp. CA-252034 TaxID=3239906 RepID=UPI003D96B2EA